MLGGGTDQEQGRCDHIKGNWEWLLRTLLPEQDVHQQPVFRLVEFDEYVCDSRRRHSLVPRPS